MSVKILSIDLGKTSGIVFDNGCGNIKHEEFSGKSYLDFHNKVEEYIAMDPDVILIPYPTRFYYTIISQAKLMGIVCLLAEQFDITVIEVQDKTCKKVVLGKGNAKKEDIAKHFDFTGWTGEHELDALLFSTWYRMSI